MRLSDHQKEDAIVYQRSAAVQYRMMIFFRDKVEDDPVQANSYAEGQRYTSRLSRQIMGIED